MSRLEVGSREEPDGRHSLVRLHLDREISNPVVATPDPQSVTTPTNPISASENLRR